MNKKGTFIFRALTACALVLTLSLLGCKPADKPEAVKVAPTQPTANEEPAEPLVFSAEQIAAARQMANFTHYQCTGTTDAGLTIFASFPKLQKLTRRGVAVTGSSLSKLPHPELLVSLNMTQSRITDAEVVYLQKMSSLQDLTLSETALTDAAVDTLVQLTSLTRLTMTQTEVSPEGFKRLAESLPNCSIRSN